MQIVLWSYSGKRDYLDDPAFAAWSITDNVTFAFPPTLVSVGNADPLRPHSELLAGSSGRKGSRLRRSSSPTTQQPPLGHEYQFDLDSEAGQLFLERMRTFLRQRLGAPSRP